MGEIAASATSFCWAFTSIQFTLAGRRTGSEVVNRVRLILAVLFLSLIHLFLYGQLWSVPAGRGVPLGMVGIIGNAGSGFRGYVPISILPAHRYALGDVADDADAGHQHLDGVGILRRDVATILIPLTHWIFQETVTPRSILGTVVAVTGATVIFLT